MKKLILLLVLVATANAQTSGPFPFGQFGGSNSSGPTLPVLFYMDGATGTNGAQVTTSNLNAYGSSYCNTGLTVTTANSQLVLSNAISQAVPPMAYSVGGVTIPKNNSAYFFEYNPTDTTSYYVGCNFSSPSNSAVSYGSYYYTTMNGSVDPSGLSIVEGTTTGGSDYAVTHWNGNACGSLTTNAAIHITASDSGAICFSPSHLYYLAGLQNNGGSSYNGGGYHYLMMLDPSNSYQIVGVTRVVNGFSAARNPILYVLGRDGADGSAGTGQTYFGYPVICSPTTYPCVPATPTANAPTYDNGTGTYVNTVTVHASDLVPTTDLGLSTDGVQYCTDTAGTCTPGSTGTTHGTLTCAYGSGGVVGCGGVTITTTGTHLRTQAVSTGWTSSSITDATYTISVVTNPSYVQSQSVLCSSTSTCTITFTNPVSGGDYIGVDFPGVSAPAATSVTDNCNTGGTSNSYTILDNSVTSGAGRAGQAVASIGANTASCSVTINLPSSATYLFPAIEEISYTSGVDVHTAHNQTAPGAGTNAVTSTAVTTTHNNELILGWCGVGSINGANAISAGTGFTQRQVPSANAMLSEDLSQSTAGSIAATCTMTQGGAIYTLAGVMAFKP
jgi:hypothetical protein